MAGAAGTNCLYLYASIPYGPFVLGSQGQTIGYPGGGYGFFFFFFLQQTFFIPKPNKNNYFPLCTCFFYICGENKISVHHLLNKLKKNSPPPPHTYPMVLTLGPNELRMRHGRWSNMVMRSEYQFGGGVGGGAMVYNKKPMI